MIMITNLIHFLEKFKHSVNLIRIHERALLPARQTDMAAGYDLSSVEDLEIPPHGRALVHTGNDLHRKNIVQKFRIEIRIRCRYSLYDLRRTRIQPQFHRLLSLRRARIY